ncbi:MAG: penicillin-binding protein activator [Candidatus Rariloculaceae bacterium]
MKIRLQQASIVAGIIFLWGCAVNTPTTLTANQQMRQRAEELALSGDIDSAIDIYSALIATGQSGTRTDDLIAGAQQLVYRGETVEARRWLARVGDHANEQQSAMILVLSAEIALEEQHPGTAIEILKRVGQSENANLLLAKTAIEGRALFELNQVELAVAALVERELWLTDSDAIAANHELIWNGLRKQIFSGPLIPSGELKVDGWLALLPVATTYRSNPSSLETNLLRWRDEYPSHPAATAFLVTLLERYRLSQIYPDNVALLLPLGSRRDESSAIRDGFIAAHFRTSNKEYRSRIKIYDTDELGGEGAYSRAEQEGADFIVGPLLKPNVDSVVGSAGQTPTLALNFVQNDAFIPPAFFQFALAPEDEAAEVARHATSSGARSAIALVPDSDWGERLLTSFRTEFEKLGGELLQFRSYNLTSQDFSPTITDLLNLTRSNQRHQRLAANLRLPLEFEPRRRQDIDIIFVATNANNGRLLAPQLRFHYAGNLPTYTTSAVFDAGSVSDLDLDGVLFPQSPWLLESDAASAELKETLADFWPQRIQNAPELFAMGFDAYRLIPLLYNPTAEFTAFPAMSGELSLDANGRVRRRLPLAQFRRGKPVALRSEDEIILQD